jgi:hypothetical protein
MAKILVSVRRIDTQSGFDIPTTADMEIIVKDSPANVDRHLHLIGLLSTATLILSDDDGKFSVTIQEKENKYG